MIFTNKIYHYRTENFNKHFTEIYTRFTLHIVKVNMYTAV